MNNLIIYQLKSQFKLKALILQIIFFSILTVWLLNSPDLLKNYKEEQKLNLGVVNEDTNPMIGILINSFESNQPFNAQFKIYIDDKENVQKDFKEAKLDCYIVIPDGFTKSLLGYGQEELQIFTKDGFPTQRLLLKNIFNSYAEYIKLTNAATITLYQHLSENGFTEEQLTDSNNKFSIEMIQAAMGRQSHFKMTTYNQMATASSSDYYIISLSLVVISLIAATLSAKTLVFIDSKIGERILITGISNIKYLLAIHIVNFLSMGFSLLFIIALASLFKLNLINLIITLMMASFFWSSMFLTMALLSNNNQTMLTIAIPIAITFATIGGALTPIAILPNSLKQLASLSPHFAMTSFCLQLPTEQHFLLFFYLLIAALLLPIQAKLLAKRIRS